MATKKTPKNPKYLCEHCGFTTNNKKDFNKHLLTRKHRINDPSQHFAQNKSQISQQQFKCVYCKKEYASRSGLWRHEKKCCNKEESPIISSDVSFLTNLVLEVVKKNSELLQQNQEFQKQSNELQKQMLEVCKNTNTNNIHHNNNNNKTFNMQFFLNEQCKDAMNIMDFVDTFKLQFSDLERVGEVGYVEGISDIIIRKLSEMDIYKRPIHCSDTKRETLYVKDNNVWEKENGNYNKLRLAIKHITKKNTDMLNPWCLKHPGSCDSDNYLNDIYLEMVMQAMGGRGGMEENENKIIKKIAKTVFIDKDL
jgi:hypothetical protein